RRITLHIILLHLPGILHSTVGVESNEHSSFASDDNLSLGRTYVVCLLVYPCHKPAQITPYKTLYVKSNNMPKSGDIKTVPLFPQFGVPISPMMYSRANCCYKAVGCRYFFPE